MTPVEIGLTVALIACFVWACAASAQAYTLQRQADFRIDSHTREVEIINKMGKWYQNRVDELEQETALLAAQVVAGGSVAVRNAMPLPGRDAEEEWAYDATGLVREKLDPRDVPANL